MIRVRLVSRERRGNIISSRGPCPSPSLLLLLLPTNSCDRDWATSPYITPLVCFQHYVGPPTHSNKSGAYDYPLWQEFCIILTAVVGRKSTAGPSVVQIPARPELSQPVDRRPRFFLSGLRSPTLHTTASPPSLRLRLYSKTKTSVTRGYDTTIQRQIRLVLSHST